MHLVPPQAIVAVEFVLVALWVVALIFLVRYAQRRSIAGELGEPGDLRRKVHQARRNYAVRRLRGEPAGETPWFNGE